MKIAYTKKHILLNLIMGLIWLTYFLVIFFTNDELNWTEYGWVVFSGIYLTVYFCQKNYKYLTIKNGYIQINTPFGKKMHLNKIKTLKKFTGDYILKTDSSEITINTHIIDPESLKKLQSELEKLNIEWQ